MFFVISINILPRCLLDFMHFLAKQFICIYIYIYTHTHIYIYILDPSLPLWSNSLSCLPDFVLNKTLNET